MLYARLVFPGASVVKNLPASAGDTDSIPGLGGSLGEGNGNQSSILPWEIPGLVVCSPWDHKRARHSLVTKQQTIC